MRCLFFVEVCEKLYLSKGQGDRMLAELFLPLTATECPEKQECLAILGLWNRDKFCSARGEFEQLTCFKELRRPVRICALGVFLIPASIPGGNAHPIKV